jgi:hypothetical protein
MNEELELEEFWSQRTIEEKRLLIDYYNNHINKVEGIDAFSPIFENYQPFFENICDYLSINDLFQLSMVSKGINQLISLVDIAIKRRSFSQLVRRLIQISGNRLKIQPRKVFDEKCRYVALDGSRGNICSICKFTGVICTFDHMCRGTIYDKHPEQFFDQVFNLKYHNKLSKDQKELIKNDLKPLFEQATKTLSKMPKYQKKRQFIELWDESDTRRNKHSKI